MDHLAQQQRNETNYYSHSQSHLNYNRSSINIPPTTGYLQQQSSSVPNMTSRTSRLSRPPEEWKKSSSSLVDSGWKTTSNNSNKQMESWKMSGKPRHAQLSTIQHDDVHTRRQSAPIFNSPAWHPKPLPIEPTPIIQHDYNVYPPVMEDYTQQQAPFHLATPMQQPAFIRPPQQDFYPQNYSNNNNSPPTQYPPSLTQYPAAQQYPPTQPQTDYPPDFGAQPYAPPQPAGYNYNYPPASSHEYPLIDQGGAYQHPEPPITQAISLQDPPKTPEKATKKKDANAKAEKKVRQITVQSINAEHRVWIDVLPAETGLSLAEKIHIIATFRTRKIVSIQTKSGRKVPLDNRPVFGSWMDMENFEDGERWTVEWRENDRGVMDKFMSKIVQAGGGKRKDHVAKD